MKILIALALMSQDTTIILYSIPYYDSLGNMITYVKKYDHIPTKQDTVEFGYRIDMWRGKTKKINSHKPKKQ